MSYAAPRPPALVDAPPLDAAVVASPGYVGLVTRTLAFAVDAAVVNLVAVLTTAAIGLAVSVLSLPAVVGDALVVIGGVGYVVWSVGYFVGFWATTGQTPGARLFRFRVQTAASGTLSVRRALLRFAAVILAALPLLAGFLLILVDARRRGLHDRIARTIVVEASGPGTIAVGAPAPGDSLGARSP
jgi:uncharacterized RDD family membrane protein YckC